MKEQGLILQLLPREEVPPSKLNPWLAALPGTEGVTRWKGRQPLAQKPALHRQELFVVDQELWKESDHELEVVVCVGSIGLPHPALLTSGALSPLPSGAICTGFTYIQYEIYSGVQNSVSFDNCIKSCIQHHSFLQNRSINAKILGFPFVISPIPIVSSQGYQVFWYQK